MPVTLPVGRLMLVTNPDLIPDKLSRKRRKSIVMTIGGAIFYPDSLAIDTRLAQTFLKGIRIGQWLCRPLMEESYHRDTLLRSPDKRHRGTHSAQQADELTPLQMTEPHRPCTTCPLTHINLHGSTRTLNAKERTQLLPD
jgi:hypothetical protein